MEINDLKGKHLAAVQAHLQSLTILYPEIDEDQDQMLVRLAMLLHDEDPTNIGRADELLDSPAGVYLAYTSPIINLNGAAPAATLSADGTHGKVTLPMSGKAVTVNPLTGRQWRLGLTDAQRLPRTALMCGLEIEDCQEMGLLDYLTLEKATVPFVREVWIALGIGGGSSASSSESKSDSPT